MVLDAMRQVRQSVEEVLGEVRPGHAQGLKDSYWGCLRVLPQLPFLGLALLAMVWYAIAMVRPAKPASEIRRVVDRQEPREEPEGTPGGSGKLKSAENGPP